MATNRKVQVIKHFELKIADLDRTDDIESKISRLENRFKQASGQNSRTNSLLLDILKNLNERISTLENAQGR